MHIHILLTSVLSHSFSLFMVVSIIMDVLPLFYFDFLLSVVCFLYHKVKYFHAQASSDCYGRTNCSLMSICRLTELNEVQVILLRHSHYHNGRRKLKVIFGARSDFAQTNFASNVASRHLDKKACRPAHGHLPAPLFLGSLVHFSLSLSLPSSWPGCARTLNCNLAFVLLVRSDNIHCIASIDGSEVSC